MKKRIYAAIVITFFVSVLLGGLLAALFLLTQNDVSSSNTTLCITIFGVVSCLCAIIFARLFSGKIATSVENIGLDKVDKAPEYEELNNFVARLGRQNELIRRQMEDLKRRQLEFNVLTENMSEGFLLIDAKSEIISYNKSALSMLGADNVSAGDHFISINRSHAFVSAVGNALKGESATEIMTSGPKVYKIFANPITSDEKITGVAVVIRDITEEERREEMRREFTSNVSHELKTPLTTISGISELLINGMVKKEDIPKFAQNIHEEASRLIVLINDIIKLSRLDEAVDPVMPVSLDLFEVARDVKERLAMAAAEKDVEIALSGENIMVDGNLSLLFEMIYNLCDNAIKYNKPSGRVEITVGYQDGKKMICVKDTGIGIPDSHLSRIFERFYRVDKSHSKSVGGTGLGLSIVKHVAEYHKATLSVESKLDVGTTISVIFP